MIWQTALAKVQADGTPHVLVTILAVSGSAPRVGGSKMVVTQDDVVDTIGGGQLELLAIQHARQILGGEQPSEQHIEHYPLAATALQCCGGAVTLLYEPLGLSQPDVVIFGAGHVGQAVLGLLEALPVRTTVLDARPAWLEPARAQHKLLLPEAVTVDGLTEQDLMQWVPVNAWVFVLTHDHLLDYQLIAALMQRADLRFLGLIGSTTKWQNFSLRLQRDGASATELARVQCPIGDGGTRFKEPAAIAIDVVAKLLRDISKADLPRQTSTASSDSSAKEAANGKRISKRQLREQVPGLFH